MLFKLTSGKYGPGKTLYLDTFHPVIRRHVRDFFLLLVVNLLPLLVAGSLAETKVP